MRLRPNDIKASVVVFLVALPLCMGIALGSNAPISSGLIAGIVGGIVLGLFGGSQVSVSGPAAGLTVIVAQSIAQLGSFEIFLASVFVAGLLQILLGLLKAGRVGDYFPASVIKGMLAAIGLILILKQIPHAMGVDKDFFGDSAFWQKDGTNTFSFIFESLSGMSPGPFVVFLFSLFILLFWDKAPWAKHPVMSYFPASLIAVVAGAVIAIFATSSFGWEFLPEQMVNLPLTGGVSGIYSYFRFPDFSMLGDKLFWQISVTIGLVASIETLLSLDAADDLDPHKRVSYKNKELMGQGMGNMLCGLIGGLPITAVIVRSTANVMAGGETRVSPFLHGIWLLVAIIFLPEWLNFIPLSALAAILMILGYKLASPKIFKNFYKKGIDQAMPFFTTVVAILFTDLLVGIFIGLCVGLFWVLKRNQSKALILIQEGNRFLLRFNKDISFLNKSRLRNFLRDLPEGSTIVIDGSRSVHIDQDIVEVIENFLVQAPEKKVQVSLQKSPLSLCRLFKCEQFE